jgi:hypothetical protein
LLTAVPGPSTFAGRIHSRRHAGPQSLVRRHVLRVTTAREPITVRLDKLDDAVDAVPYLLGFTPTDSLVAIALRGPRERMSFTMRLDLMPPRDDDEVARAVAARMAAARARSVMLFVYPKRRPSISKPLPRHRLIAAIDKALDMPVRDAVLVTPERIWSYVCDDHRCCPPEGRLRPSASPGQLALEAAHALNGRAVLPTRADVVASVQPLAGLAAARLDAAIEAAAAQYVSMTPRRFVRHARGVAQAARDRYLDRPGDLTDDDAAVLIVGMHEWQLRDEMLGWATTHEDAMRSLFADLARRALPPLDAPACTALAFIAYVQGDGLVTATALDRALDSEPDYSLAVMLRDALTGQLPPKEIRRALKGFVPET